MSPITHGLISWSVANTAKLGRKDRAIVLLAGIVPDIDGAGVVIDLAGRLVGRQFDFWSRYHHVLCHNIGFFIVFAIAAFFFSTRRWVTGLLVCISFHVHLLGDLLGSRGPEGYQWPIPYLQPFSDAWQLAWTYQWPLNAWPNVAITFTTLALAFYLAWKNGVSPLELVSAKANRTFVEAIRNRFGNPHAICDQKVASS